ncbi:hypothetical protein RJ639_022846 [Escallonia herrerae]|uniref:Uncharacterized protein n=1 Tax=Escallonia herrerae TaxID=1293975 RepID=A0AA88V2H1_9ASTE|nr:hypothetical protein RJ639_022846 [Escallonia herrerae]
MPDGFNNWEVEGTKGQNRSTSFFEELSSLNCLRALETHIPGLMCFPKEKICKNLTRYDIRCRGDDRILLSLPRSSRKAVIIKGEDFIDFKGGIKFLVERAEALFLTLLRLHDLRKVFNERKRESFVDLKYLKVHLFLDMDYLLGLQRPVSRNHTQLSRGSFSELTVLDVFRCGFKYLFRASVARGLVQLVHLKIKECVVMEEVVRIENQGEEEEIKSLVVFPRLKSLKLRSLPGLTSFNSKMSKTSATLGNCSFAARPLFDGKVQLSESEIRQLCLRSKDIFLQQSNLLELEAPIKICVQNVICRLLQVAFPALEELEIFCIESAREIWDSHSFIEESFYPLRVLEVYECDKLEIVVPSAVLPRLENLEVFSVQNCASVTVISEFQGLNVAEPFAAAMTLLPRLRKVKFKRLPKLTQMGLNSNKNCLGNLVCPNVTTLSIDGCNSIRQVLSPCMARSLVNLEKLKVRNCEEMKEIIAATEKGQDESYEELVFPKLRCLVLSDYVTSSVFGVVDSKNKKRKRFPRGN